MSIRYNEMREIIASNPDVAEFADFGDGVSDELIQKAELALGFSLPPSYKWWLSNYGGGEVGGEEIFSIYEEDFDSVVGGDVVYMRRLNQQSGLLGPKHLSICESDVDGVFAFDYSRIAVDGECPVVAITTGDVYAADFLCFLKKRIVTFCS